MDWNLLLYIILAELVLTWMRYRRKQWKVTMIGPAEGWIFYTEKEKGDKSRYYINFVRVPKCIFNLL